MSFIDLFPMTFLSGRQWLALLPLVCMTMTAIATLLFSALKHEGRAVSLAMLFIGSLAAVGAVALFPMTETVTVLDGVLVIDKLSQAFSVLVALAGIAAALMSIGFDEREDFQTEYFSMIAFAVVGMMAMVSTRNLVMFFVSLELMSLAVYVLVSMHRQSPLAAEAGLKYFLLGGAASAVLLYGASLIYGTTGSLDVASIRLAMESQWQGQLPVLALLGVGLFSIGFLFKIGAVPFHVWIPDVYTGAATPVTGFMISAVKAAATGAFLRMTMELFAPSAASEPVLIGLLSVIIVLTLVFGSFVGLRQTRLKRIFAYSTIVHTGYVLLGILALMSGGDSDAAASAVFSYTIFYVVMNIGAFAVLTMISPVDSDDITLDELSGLGRRRPFMAFAMSLFLLSMAGIPPTAGFFGKYYLFSAALSTGHTTITVIAALASVVSALIYLRPMIHMYMKEGHEPEEGMGGTPWLGSTLIMSLALFLTVAMGLLPAWFSRLL